MNKEPIHIGIKLFNPDEIKNNSTILIIGKRNTGKSVFLKDLMYHKQQVSTGVVFAGTENANGFYGSFIPDSFVHNDYKPDIITRLIARQERKQLENEDRKINKPIDDVFVILDDLNYKAKEWKNEETMKYLFSNGRHNRIFLVIALQYIMSLTPELRANADYVVVFAQSSAKAKRKVFDEFGGCFENFETFNYIFDSCTKDYCCLVIKTTGNGMADQVFWYKADISVDFKMGDHAIWKYHQKQYNKNYRRDSLLKKLSGNDNVKKVKVTINRLENK
jgi:hypothetical protein